jgi:hypothetical protein
VNVCRFINSEVSLSYGAHTLRCVMYGKRDKSEGYKSTFSVFTFTYARPLTPNLAAAAVTHKDEKSAGGSGTPPLPSASASASAGRSQPQCKSSIDRALRCTSEHCMERQHLRLSTPQQSSGAGVGSGKAPGPSLTRISSARTSALLNDISNVSASTLVEAALNAVNEKQRRCLCEFCGLPTPATRRSREALMHYYAGRSGAAEAAEPHELEYAVCSAQHSNGGGSNQVSGGQSAGGAKGSAVYAHLACAARTVYYVEVSWVDDMEQFEEPVFGLITGTESVTKMSAFFLFSFIVLLLSLSDVFALVSCVLVFVCAGQFTSIAKSQKRDKHPHPLHLRYDQPLGWNCHVCFGTDALCFKCTECDYQECSRCHSTRRRLALACLVFSCVVCSFYFTVR